MTEALADAYARVRREATSLAGKPDDIPRRAVQLHTIYVDSEGNHTFPQLALHGTLWANRFFGATGPIVRAISCRYVHDPAEMERRNAMLHRFFAGFNEANRSVFVDTYTDYYFTKDHGDFPGADEFVAPELLDGLQQIHHAVRFNRPVNVDDRRAIFVSSLMRQEETVGPKVLEEVGKLDCPILAGLVLKPFVRYAYFPPWRYMHFRNFADGEERLGKAIDSYELAEAAGWLAVVETMRHYDVLPRDLSLSG